MATSARRSDDEHVALGLLVSVERDGATSQRRLATDLGIAAGLVNAISIAVKKGLVKVMQAPLAVMDIIRPTGDRVRLLDGCRLDWAVRGHER